MRNQNKQAVAQIVRQYLQDRHPDGVNLDIDEPGIRKDKYFWYVPVRPSTEPRKRYEYYEALADVEGELEDREELKVLLVPSDPVETPVT